MPAQDLDILKHLTSMEEPMDIIDMLDVDENGEIGIDQFLNGLWQLVISKVPVEMRLELKRMQKSAREQTRGLLQAIEDLNVELVRIRSSTKMGDPYGYFPPCRNPVQASAWVVDQESNKRMHDNKDHEDYITLDVATEGVRLHPNPFSVRRTSP